MEETLARIRRHVRIPLGIDFRDAHAARDTTQRADAVVIGAWLIESLADKSAADALAAASDLIRSIRRQLDVEAPALIKGYLRCGAKVLGAPAWDPDFNTADLPLLLRVDDLPARYRKHFF